MMPVTADRARLYPEPRSESEARTAQIGSSDTSSQHSQRNRSQVSVRLSFVDGLRS